jgi:hypothetical protein
MALNNDKKLLGHFGEKTWVMMREAKKTLRTC